MKTTLALSLALMFATLAASASEGSSPNGLTCHLSDREILLPVIDVPFATDHQGNQMIAPQEVEQVYRDSQGTEFILRTFIKFHEKAGLNADLTLLKKDALEKIGLAHSVTKAHGRMTGRTEIGLMLHAPGHEITLLCIARY